MPFSATRPPGVAARGSPECCALSRSQPRGAVQLGANVAGGNLAPAAGHSSGFVLVDLEVTLRRRPGLAPLLDGHAEDVCQHGLYEHTDFRVAQGYRRQRAVETVNPDLAVLSFRL